MPPCRQEDGDGEPEDTFSDMDSVPGDDAGLEGLSASSFNMELMWYDSISYHIFSGHEEKKSRNMFQVKVDRL